MKLQLAALVMLSTPAHSAAAGEIAIDRFSPSEDPDGFLAFAGTVPAGAGRGNLGVQLSHRWQPSMLNVGHRLLANLVGQLGVGRRLTMGFGVPMLLYQTPAVPVGVGDPTLSGRIRIFGRANPTPSRVPIGSGLALRFAAHLPTGQAGAGLSERQIRIDAQVLADWRALGFAFGAMLGWRFRPTPIRAGSVVIDDELHVGLAFELPMPFYPRLVGRFGVHCAVHASAPFSDAARTLVEGTLGFRFKMTPQASITIGLGRRHTAAWGNPRLRTWLQLQWKPRLSDLDEDGIRDRRDRCPQIPAGNPDIDRDGCPDD